MSVNAFNLSLFQAFSKVYYVWSVPLVLLVFAGLEYRLVKWSALIALVFIALVVPAQLFLAKLFTNLR